MMHRSYRFGLPQIDGRPMELSTQSNQSPPDHSPTTRYFE